MAATWLTIQSYKQKSSDLEFQATQSYEIKMLKQKISANEKEEVILEFNTDKEIVRNKMDGIEDKTSQEYKDCLTEIQELQDAKDDALKLIEDEAKRYEDEIDQEVSMIQTRKEAVDADIESLEQARQEDIEKFYDMFQ